MSPSTNILYLPYGAHALKASYQRNLAKAGLLVTGTVGLIVGTLWVMSILLVQPKVIVGPPPDDGIIIISLDLPTPPNISRPPADLPTASPPVKGAGYIPIPVDDELFEGEDQVILSQADLASLDDGLGEGGVFDTGAGGVPGTFVPSEDVLIEYPEPDVFVYREVEPEMVHEVAPEYPRSIRNMGMGGKVIVQALVDIDGKVREVRVARSSGMTGLDDAAVAAAYKCTYTPALQNGHPIAVWVSYSVVFEID